MPLTAEKRQTSQGLIEKGAQIAFLSLFSDVLESLETF